MVYEVLVSMDREGALIDSKLIKGVSSYVCFCSESTIDVSEFDFVTSCYSLDENFYKIIDISDTILLDDTDVMMAISLSGYKSVISYIKNLCEHKNVFFITKSLTGKNYIRDRLLFSKSDDRFTIEKNGTLKSIKH